MPQTPVQGSGAHEPLLSREATSHSLTAMLVWSCRLKMWTQKVLHVRSTTTKATVRDDHMSAFGGGKKEAIFLPPLFSKWLSMQIGENQEEAKGNVSLGHNSSTVRREKQNREV